MDEISSYKKIAHARYLVWGLPADIGFAFQFSCSGIEFRNDIIFI